MACSDGSDSPPPPTIVSIDVEPPLAFLDIGTWERFRAIATYSDGTLEEVSAQATWSLEYDNGTATGVREDPGGRYVVEGVMAGQENVVAALESVVGKAAVEVVGAELIELIVTPRSAHLQEGDGLAFKARGTYDDGHEQDLTDESDWTSDDSAVASVEQTGIVRAHSPGTTNISASVDGLTESAFVEVHERVELDFIEVTPQDATIFLDGSRQFSALAHYTDGSRQNITRSALWRSSDNGVVTHDVRNKGRFNSVAQGSAVVTAEYGFGNEGTSNVTVEEVVLTHIITTPRDATVEVGKTRRYFTEAQASNGIQYSTNHLEGQSYEVADPSIAYISSYQGNKGNLTALSEGTTTVISTFVYEGETFTDEVPITVCAGDSC